MAIAEADFGMTRMAMDQNTGRNVGDETLLVRFYTHPKQSKAKSTEAGRPIFEEKEYIEIIQPGNKDSIVNRPVSQMDIERFPEHYRKWKAREGEHEAVEGTLLAHWPAVTRSQVEELRYLNIHTVEQLAAISDANAQNVMGINLLKTRAKEYLEASQNQAYADEMRVLREQNEQMMEQIQKLNAALEVQDEAPKKRGRPKKTEEAPETE